MPPSTGWHEIDLFTIRRAVADYPNRLKAGLAELDTVRFVTIPETLRKRRQEKQSAGLTREEATSLIEWKLSVNVSTCAHIYKTNPH